MKRTFLHLPAELRNKIYELVLLHHRPLQVIRSWIKRRGDYALKSEYSSCMPTLLATCRAINKEATPILYGGNNIIIGCAHLPQLVTEIRASIKHLRHVEVGFYGSISVLRSAMRALQRAGELEILTIGIYIFGDAKNAWEMARGLWPWVKAQCERRRSSSRASREQKRDVRDVVKVLKFVGREFTEDGMGVTKLREKYEEEVRGKLVELMK